MKCISLGAISYLLIFSIQIRAQELADYQAKIESAIDLIDEAKTDEALNLLKPLTKLEQPEIIVKVQRVSGQAYIKANDFEEATDILNAALILSRTTYNRLEEANCLYLLGRLDAFTGKFEEALIKAQNGAYIARAIQNDQLEFQINSLLSWAYFMTEVNFNRVLEHEARQFELMNLVDDKKSSAGVYNNLGYDLTVSGTVPIDSTILLMEFANDTYGDLENTGGRWYTLMNLTWQHRLKNDLEASKKYGEKSCAQAKVDNDRHAILEACFQLAETLIEMDRISEAKEIYETGLKWRGEQEDRDSYVFDIYYSRFLWEAGKKDEAVSRLEKAVKFLETSEVFYEMHGRALLLSYYLDNKDLTNARGQLEMLDNPRHNYIAFETRCLAAMAKAKLMALDNQKNATALMRFWLEHANEIGATQYVKLIERTLNSL